MTPLLYALQVADAALPRRPWEYGIPNTLAIIIAVVLIAVVLMITAAAVVVLIIVLKRVNASNAPAAKPSESRQQPSPKE